MAKVAGHTGKVNIDGAITDIKSWTLDWVVDQLDTTDMDSSGNKEIITGLSGGSGTILIDWDSTVTPKTPGTSITSLKLYLNATKYYHGAGYITGVHSSVSVDGLDQITYDFTLTGAIAFA